MPPVEDAGKLREKAGLLSGKAYTDYALYGVLRRGNIDRFKEMVEAGPRASRYSWGPRQGTCPAQVTRR